MALRQNLWVELGLCPKPRDFGGIAPVSEELA